MTIKVIQEFSALKDRASFGTFQGKYGSHVTKAEADTKTLKSALDQAMQGETPLSKALDGFGKSVGTAVEEVQKHEVHDVNDKGAREIYAEAQRKLSDAEYEFEKFLKGEKKIKGEEGVEVAVTPELKKAFTNATDSIKKCTGIMNAMFGMARVEGIKEAAQHNINKVIGKAEATALERGFRGGAAVAAGAAISDAVLRSKGRDDEDRSKTSRMLELLAGVGVGTTAVLSGHAR